jgi:hypothetical protein
VSPERRERLERHTLQPLRTALAMAAILATGLVLVVLALDVALA